ncbi:unnamed protein product [Rotaria magnacalcarata]|uniref:DNA topoisomerase (ATP-hydrolyzing) n=1 Tax=Rotaria magnacalcarata TaxID=392030 RepID=A0A8S2ZV46_9BILA|nr:unnamed protein product [Rotaria magnacalcarata]
MLIKRREQNLSADYLYKKDTKLINFDDFINKELALFSKTSTQHAISIGQFGTCLHGGNGAASTRYIFTRICPFAVSLFNNDELVLTYLNEDGMSIESE